MKFFAMTIIFFLVSISVWAETQYMALSSKRFQQLQNEGMILKESDKNTIGILAPEVSNITRELETYKALEPRVATETIMYIPTSKPLEKMYQMYYLFTHPSLLTGIQYTKPYRNNEIGILFASSQMIDTPESRTTIPETTSDEIISREFYVLQDFPPFGDIASRIDLTANAEYMNYRVRNYDVLKHNGITVVAREQKMFIHVTAWIYQDGIIVYGLGGVRTTPVTALVPRYMKTRFGSRINGLFRWVYQYMKQDEGTRQ